MTASTVLELKPSQILPHPSNPRQQVGDVTELAASIKAHGLMQNLVVAPRPEGMKGPKAAEYVLIAGHRRLAAAKRAGLATVTAKVDQDLIDAGEQIAAMLSENGQREDLSAIEEAEVYQGCSSSVGPRPRSPRRSRSPAGRSRTGSASRPCPSRCATRSTPTRSPSPTPWPSRSSPTTTRRTRNFTGTWARRTGRGRCSVDGACGRRHPERGLHHAQDHRRRPGRPGPDRSRRHQRQRRHQLGGQGPHRHHQLGGEVTSPLPDGWTEGDANLQLLAAGGALGSVLAIGYWATVLVRAHRGAVRRGQDTPWLGRW